MSEQIAERERAVVAEYERRAAAYRGESEAAHRGDRQLGVARIAAFLLAAWQLWALAARREPVLVALALAIAFGTAFVVLVSRNRRVRARAQLFAALERSCSDGIARVERQWGKLPEVAELPDTRDHAFAHDLHVGGTHSLARLLPAMSRAAGRSVMFEWLLAESPPPLATVRARQSAAAELSPRAEWRERLSVYASRLAISPRGLETFLTWAEQSEPPKSPGAVRWATRLLAVATVASFLAALAGALPAAVPTLLFVLNVIVTAAARRRLNGVLDVIAGHEWRLRGLADTFGLVAAERFTAPRLIDLATQAGGERGVLAFGRFDRLARLSEVRLSPMGHVVLQVLTLWDFHVVDAIEGWRREHGREIRARLQALGEIEALAALAALAHDNPSWSFPTLDETRSTSLEATALAHPLLAADVRVANDVMIGPSGDILLITGSNMSGKSTLLRAIGLNVVLAQLGGPVCAAALRLAPVRLRTSIEARDALDRGLSLFMSELLRIKSIVDAARASSPYPLLYIADEMLRGTNAADRHAAVVMILTNLVDAGAVGVVATHDPELAADSSLQRHLHAFHFVEHVDAAREVPMWFDYKLRPGLSSTRNAMRLVELVGLTSRTGAAAPRGR